MNTLLAEYGRYRVYREWSTTNGYYWRVYMVSSKGKSDKKKAKQVEIRKRKFWNSKDALAYAKAISEHEKLDKALPSIGRVKAADKPREIQVGDLNLFAQTFKRKEEVRKIDI